MPRKIHSYGKDTELLQVVNYSRFLPGTIAEKITWMTRRGYPISESSYKKTLAFLRNDVEARLNYIVYKEFADEYIQAIDRAKEDLAKCQRLLNDPNITPGQFAQLYAIKLKGEKWLLELYDADVLVAHTMEKIHEAQMATIIQA